MKKIVIFIITILILGVLAMTTCIQNSKRIEQEKIKLSRETIKHYIEYIEIDLYMSENEKMYYRHELRKGIDIN